MGLIEQIRAAGVVGAGGAGFPTDKKLDCSADVFIANGIECEPLLRTDRHVMELYAPELVRTVRAIGQHLHAKRTVIALKKHYSDALAALRKAIAGTEIEIYLSPSFYPAGDEQNLVYSVTGRVVPTGGIPLDVGCVVNNVSTVLNIAHAMDGEPVTEKIVTVAGSVAKPVTIRCAIGTPLQKLLDAAGGALGDCSFITGGPLMGKITDNLSEVVTKTTGGLLAIPKGHVLLRKRTSSPRDTILARAACSQCTMCTQMCPRNAMGLDVQPHKAMRVLASGNDRLLGDANGIFSCCECGVCTYYACNFDLKPSQAMQRAKAALQKEGVKPMKEVRYAPEKGIEIKRIPTERLLLRTDLKRFDVDAPVAGYVDTNVVRLPLRMHIGAPDRPLVSKGQKVRKGQLIAVPDGLGANIHASIDGTVSSVSGVFVEIRK